MSVLGDNIKKYRELSGYTQKQLADAIGKTKNVISNWENGLNKPDADMLELLMGLLKVDANTLFGWVKPEQIKSDARELADDLLSNPKINNVIPILEKMSLEDIDTVISLIRRLSK